ncbi:allantoinase [Ktedonosporobacter rubrisoli]|uniref:Allantoinase n=1 Tax=Ktedonosporobacter rubrisoli TaxID=2509675 RepID=A0A4P6JTY3_KTERU|nr:allantoinase [Ktedonosporobacter rubrisoli]QBD78770.1 allantoinase [Ktedonosporobacter rubrisoli]
MSKYDLIIRRGILVTPHDTVQADLAISDGHIVALEPELSGTCKEEIDARELLVFPGIIDAHVHFNEPGRTHWEGFQSGTRALAAGGTTSFFDMPLNSSPPVLDAKSFELKRKAAQASSLVDFGLWGGLVPGNLAKMAELAERGVIGFKAFMSNSGIDDFAAADDLTLYEGMAQAARLGRIVAVHAESEQLTSALARRAQTQGRTGIRDYLNSRPILAELEAIQRAVLFAGETGCALHIVHVSSGRGVSLVAEARARGLDVSCETCPHYLTLTEDDMETLGAVAKCAPPLRSAQEQGALWQHIFDGSLPMVATDHSPAPAEMKTDSNFFRVWGGISGCQSLLQLLLTEGYERRNLPLTLIASLAAGYVARRFDLAPAKGSLAIGADADIVLVDLRQRHTLQKQALFYRHQRSPYLGRSLRGAIVSTLVRGITVFQDGQPAANPQGKLLKPSSLPA